MAPTKNCRRKTMSLRMGIIRIDGRSGRLRLWAPIGGIGRQMVRRVPQWRRRKPAWSVAGFLCGSCLNAPVIREAIGSRGFAIGLVQVEPT